MTRSRIFVAAVGVFVGLGVAVALAQPVDWSRPTFNSATIRGSLTAGGTIQGNDLQVPTNRSVYLNGSTRSIGFTQDGTQIRVLGALPVTPNSDQAINLGTPSIRWSNAYFGGSIVYANSSGMQDLEVASDVNNSTTSFADVTGLTWTAAANTTYRFDCYIIYNTSAITTGLRIAVNGPASPTLVDMDIDYGGVTVGNAAATSAAFYQSAHIVAYDTGTATTDAVATATNYPIRVHGVIRNGGNAGTFAIRHASETANQTTIKARSYCTVH